MSDRILSIELNLEEGNLLLTALAELPFKIVYELIGKLNEQAGCQFNKMSDPSVRKPFTFTEDEISLSIRALGKFPYECVHELVGDLNRQVNFQLRNLPDQ